MWHVYPRACALPSMTMCGQSKVKVGDLSIMKVCNLSTLKVCCLSTLRVSGLSIGALTTPRMCDLSTLKAWPVYHKMCGPFMCAVCALSTLGGRSFHHRSIHHGQFIMWMVHH